MIYIYFSCNHIISILKFRERAKVGFQAGIDIKDINTDRELRVANSVRKMHIITRFRSMETEKVLHFPARAKV